jgi:hypothetical protein
MQSNSGLTRTLLAGGVITGPLFFVSAIIQGLARPGFDIRRNAISQLSLGDLGWIQITTFLLTGLLAIACAVGMRRALKGGKGGTWGAILAGALGLGLILAGIFPPDPANGFPPGAPDGQPSTMSASGSLHAVGFMLSMLSVIINCFVFARRFGALKQTGWIIYCIASVAAIPLLIVLSAVFMSWGGVIVALAGAVVFGWICAISARILSEISGP